MNILRSIFKSNNNNTANEAKERLRTLILQQRKNANLNFIPSLQKDILKVLEKYIDHVAEDQVDVKLDQQQLQSILELNVTFPSA